MIGTLLSLLTAALLAFYAAPFETDIMGSGIKAFMIAMSLSLLLIIPFIVILAWTPLQKAAEQATEQILMLFAKDIQIKFCFWYLIAFVFATLVLVLEARESAIIDMRFQISFWIVALGVAIDAARHLIKRIMSYLDPYATISLYSAKAESCIQNNLELDLCEWLDGLSEIALKAIQRHSSSLSHKSLEEQEVLIRHFLQTSASIGHPNKDEETKSAFIGDKITYVLFHFYQQVDASFERAMNHRMEMTCSYIMRMMGKVAVDAAKCDMTLASVPLRFVGKFARKAQQEGFEESTLTGACVLLGVAKQLIGEIDVTYLEIQDPFLSIIHGLEVVEKGEFQKDKTLSIPLLKQPFKELAALFDQGKVKEHKDRPIIVQNINRVLQEFDALEMVMATRPPIPSTAV